MKDVLRFLGQGFALFAGGPAVIYPYPASSWRAAVGSAEARERIIGMVRYVAFVVLGCAFVTALWATVQTHRLYAQTATVMVATGMIR